MSQLAGGAYVASESKVVVILGAACSGTAALASAIAAAEGSQVTEAGAEIGLLSVLAAEERRYGRDLDDHGGAGLGIGRSLLSEQMLHDLIDLDAGSIVWHAADVLPDVPCLNALPFLASRLPNALFVNFCRDGVDFVAHRRRAFPAIDFATHCLLWSQAQTAWAAFRPTLGDRAIDVARETDAADPSALWARLVDRLGWSDEARDSFADVLFHRPIGGGGTFGAKPIDFVSVGWSLAEKMLFAELCGNAMKALGRPLDQAAAIRRRPLRLDDVINGGHALFRDGSGQFQPGGGSAGCSVVWSEGVEGGLVVLPAMAVNGRTRLTVTAGTLAPHAPATSLRVDVIESISRRSCASVEMLIDSERTGLSATVDSTTELVDILLSARSMVAGKGFGFQLFEATLSG